MQGDRDVHGIISWRSIVTARSVGCTCETVRECMVKDIAVLPFHTPLFDAVKIVLTREVVLVQGIDKKIVGLVTTADIGEQFVTLAEPFLILEQIENHIRTLLNGRFTKEQLRDAMDSADDSRRVDAISDLTFGEYIRLLEKPDNWQSLKLSMDRATFVKRLDNVRNIRNDVMHFHPDGISEEDLARLRETAKFFYTISQFR
jgi:Mg/Co/Ni transporter MgtE